LDLDHQQRFVQAALEAVAFTGELRDVQCLGAVRVGLRAPLDRRQCGQLGDFALATPGTQGRGVHAVAAHQRADVPGLAAAVIASVRRVFSTWSSSEGGFPAVRQQLVDPAVQLRRQSREDVLEVGPGVVSVQLGRSQQARDDGSAFAGLRGTGGELTDAVFGSDRRSVALVDKSGVAL
jgi:hypothetical protein